MKQQKASVEVSRIREAGGDRRLETTVQIEAPPDQVWAALTEPVELQNWFPMNATVKPGVGGHIGMSWWDDVHFEVGIRSWDPGRHLQTEWPSPKGSLVVDYYLEGRGGGTTLRLVHSGFGPEADWDSEYDGIHSGWSFELFGLKHYLERHRGVPRVPICVKRSVEIPHLEAWNRALEALGFTDDARRIGGRVSIQTPGTRLECTTTVLVEPREIAAVVNNLNDAIARVLVERCSGPENPLDVIAWLSTYGVSAEQRKSLESFLTRTLDECFQDSGAGVVA